MKRTIALIFFVFAIFSVCLVVAQSDGPLPVREWKAAKTETLIFYICGDGGMNNFSREMCSRLNDAAYDVAALDAKSYFWERKTPEQCAADIAGYINTHAADKKIVMAGYSFGADVLPFIINRLPDNIKSNLGSVLLISPSGTTDFEIHWLDIIGLNKKRNMDVISEINRMKVVKTALFFGDEESQLMEKQVKVDTLVKIPGGHHFDYNAAKLADCLVSVIRRQ